MRGCLVDERVGLLESDVPYPDSFERERELTAAAFAKDDELRASFDKD